VLQTGHATLTAVAATVLVMNARYLLFGATLQPWLSQAGPARALPSLMLLGDANWIGTMRAIEAGEQDRAYLAGTGVPPLVVWLAGTVIGAMFGSILPDPKALAADLMLPAFAAAMMAVMIKSRGSLIPVAVGAIAALVVDQVAGHGWGIVAAGVSGAGFAALTARPMGAQ
jgi:predicted branched-subunit amino acid permease